MDEDKNKTIGPEDSILTSVKKLLGLEEDNEAFDMEIMLHINGAITILTQIGVGPTTGYIVTSKENTYSDWLGNTDLYQNIPLYLFWKTRLSFDPPTNASVIKNYQDSIREAECRLSYLVDPPNTFE